MTSLPWKQSNLVFFGTLPRSQRSDNFIFLLQIFSEYPPISSLSFTYLQLISVGDCVETVHEITSFRQSKAFDYSIFSREIFWRTVTFEERDWPLQTI